jgi:hypothetical protein
MCVLCEQRLSFGFCSGRTLHQLWEAEDLININTINVLKHQK